jgi:hypothetical protein
LEETETDSDLINYKEWILSKGFWKLSMEESRLEQAH